MICFWSPSHGSAIKFSIACRWSLSDGVLSKLQFPAVEAYQAVVPSKLSSLIVEAHPIAVPSTFTLLAVEVYLTAILSKFQLPVTETHPATACLSFTSIQGWCFSILSVSHYRSLFNGNIIKAQLPASKVYLTAAIPKKWLGDEDHATSINLAGQWDNTAALSNL